MSVLGQVFLLVALATAFGSTIAYRRAIHILGSPPTLPRLLLRLSALSLILASAVLVVQLVTHDFTNAYVFGHSDRSLPLHYLLSSFYAGQEGSFLFWALVSGLLALLLMSYTRKRGSESSVMMVFMSIQTFLIVLVLAKSPFRSLWDVYPQAPAGNVPADGTGLNPLLQNFWMVIHPPVLFVGFAAMAIPFSLAISGLWRKNYAALLELGIPWVLIATSVLGLGIMLGAYWAYGVLGWGGYWGWDPVENSSLVPWLTAIALLHTLLAQRRTGKFARTNVVLAAGSYLLVVYSTFLTRSGVLGDASVHAFADPGAAVYWLLLVFLGAILTVSALLCARRWNALAPQATATGWLTREIALGAGAVVLVLSALVILFGTSLPIFSTMRAEPSFYDATNLPLAIVMALLIGVSLHLQWEDVDGRTTVRRATMAFVASLAVTVILIVMGMHDPATTALAFTSFFALFVNVDVGLKVAKGDPLFLGGKIAHIGVAIFFLGVIGSGKYAAKEHVQLPQNAPTEVLGYTLTYEGRELQPDGKTAFRVAVHKDASRFELRPVMYNAGEQGLMRNPDIASFLTRDFYLSPVSAESADPAASGDVEQISLVKGVATSIGPVRATFVRFDMNQHDMGAGGAEGITVGAVIELVRGTEREQIVPVLVRRPDGEPVYKEASSRLLQAPVRLTAMNVGMEGAPSTISLDVLRPGSAAPSAEILVVEASTKPYVNLLWGGTVLMMLGFALAIVKRMRG